MNPMPKHLENPIGRSGTIGSRVRGKGGVLVNADERLVTDSQCVIV